MLTIGTLSPALVMEFLPNGDLKTFLKVFKLNGVFTLIISKLTERTTVQQVPDEVHE